jgi:nickel-dependent lactate racemase
LNEWKGEASAEPARWLGGSLALSDIVRLESPLVKSPHMLGTIAGRIPADDRRVHIARETGSVSSVDPAAAAMHALAEPIDYPPLAKSIVPGDRVAIAIDADVPSPVEIVQGAVESLVQAGVDSEAISIVVADDRLAAVLRAELRGKRIDGIQIELHDPDDEKNLCFVGLNRHHEPLVVNRTIYDADLVLPIGLARGRGGPFAGLFPQFSSTAVIERFRTPANFDTPPARKAQRGETSDAGRLIGVAMLMLVVPGPKDAVAHVVAGEPKAAARRAASLYRRDWSRRSAQRSSLVIATVRGGPLAQSWESAARALVAANRLVRAGGAVALCTNLDRDMGESMSQLVGSSDLRRVARKVYHEHAEDSWAAWQLARAIHRGPVYLLSQLDADTVEELGLAPVADIDELVRLAGRHESVVVLEDAQHVVAGVDEEDGDD